MQADKMGLKISKIIKRDDARSGKKYYKALRGYHARKDILNAFYKSIDINISGTHPKLIDLGCGPGIVGLYLNKRIKNLNITFLDINSKMLSSIRKMKNFTIMKGDVTKLNIKPSYDLAVMKQVLDYIPKNLQMRALHQVHKILRPSGQFVLSALISPSKDSLDLTNYLYSEREKILNPRAPVKKFIPTEHIVISWLKKFGFKNIKVTYRYDIPLSVKDFAVSFGLNKNQKKQLKIIYKNIIKKDRKNYFRYKINGNDIELIEKGVLVSCQK